MPVLVNRNVISADGRTSIRLEPEFWAALDQIAARRKVKRDELVRLAERDKGAGTLTSAVRVFVLREVGHVR